MPEQEEAKGLLRAALDDGPAHAYLFHGPRGVGKRAAAIAFAGELLADRRTGCRAARTPTCTFSSRSATRSGSTRSASCTTTSTCARSRPSRRVYLVVDADLMNEDAADALLKDLEEPPDYAVIVLARRRACRGCPRRSAPGARSCRSAGSRRGRSRRSWPSAARTSPPEQRAAVARVAGGRLDRVARLLDPDAAARRAELIELARSAYRDEAFEPLDGGASGARRRPGGGRRGRDERTPPGRRGRRASWSSAPNASRAARSARRSSRRSTCSPAGTGICSLPAAGQSGPSLNSDRAAELDEDAAQRGRFLRGAGGRGGARDPAELRAERHGRPRARGALSPPAARARPIRRRGGRRRRVTMRPWPGA